MKSIKEFALSELVRIIQQNYTKQGYKVEINSDKFQPARVPIYCKKLDEERIIEYTIDREITKTKFFPTEHIAGVEILESSPVKFYQYYFPNAKIYFAFPYYVHDNDEFIDFKKICDKNGIGLIRINKDKKVEELSESKPLLDEICSELKITDRKKRYKLEYHLRNCLHFFVYYPNPIFNRRAITGKASERMSLILIDKLVELKNIQYKNELIGLSNDYRKESQSDFEIAEKYMAELWDKYLGLKYPSIQKRAENILQQDQKYREHFVHQFQVFLIGSYILDSIYDTVAEKFEETHSCKIENVWLAASTFHDFSYGLQKFDSWLMAFFEEILRIKNNQTKRSLNLLNLDAAMIREALFDQLEKIVNHLGGFSKNNNQDSLIKFFYEKAVRDRNHGILSAITLLKLFEENKDNINRIKEPGIIDAATAIACHDEDIWEALSGCQGYLRSHGDLPINVGDCSTSCRRKQILWDSKKIRIFEESLLNDNKDGFVAACESWEREIMKERILTEIKFKDNPILFLLVFCDTIQDEGRVSSIDSLITIDRSVLENINIIINKSNSQVKINLRCNNSDAKDKKLEIERLAWMLKDSKFLISINNDPYMKMNGSGGL